VKPCFVTMEGNKIRDRTIGVVWAGVFRRHLVLALPSGRAAALDWLSCGHRSRPKHPWRAIHLHNRQAGLRSR
jgi:hypothetical protein